MKIIKYPKLPIQQCRNCKALVEIKFKDVKKSYFCGVKEIWKCKLCKYENYVKFEEAQDDSVRDKK